MKIPSEIQFRNLSSTEQRIAKTIGLMRVSLLDGEFPIRQGAFMPGRFNKSHLDNDPSLVTYTCGDFVTSRICVSEWFIQSLRTYQWCLHVRQHDHSIFESYRTRRHCLFDIDKDVDMELYGMKFHYRSGRFSMSSEDKIVAMSDYQLDPVLFEMNFTRLNSAITHYNNTQIDPEAND